MTWNGTFTGFDGLAGTLALASFSLAPNASQSFSLAIADVTGLQPGQWYFGQVLWQEAGGMAPDAHFPVAVAWPRPKSHHDHQEGQPDRHRRRRPGDVQHHHQQHGQVQPHLRCDRSHPGQCRLREWLGNGRPGLQQRPQHPDLERLAGRGTVQSGREDPVRLSEPGGARYRPLGSRA